MNRNKPNFWRKFARITTKTVLYTVLFITILLLCIRLPFVQKIIRQKAVAYLEKKLDTKVSIGEIYIDLPKKIVLRDVYIEDRQKDTLLSAGTIKTNINLWRLAFKNDLKIEDVELSDITAKIKRQTADSGFNYQFVADAFMPKKKDSTSTKDTSAAPIGLGNVKLENIRLIYNDAVAGNSVTAALDHLVTKVDAIDAVKMNFDIPETFISGLRANVSQVKPLANPEPFVVDSMEALAPMPFNLKFKQAAIENVHIDYKNDVSGLYTKADIGNLVIFPEQLDFTNRTINLANLQLENSNLAFQITKKEQAKVMVKQAAQEVESRLAAGWNVKVATIDLSNNHIVFNDANKPVLRTGIDYSHLDADSLSLQAKDVLINDEAISGKVLAGSFKEKNGFRLNALQTSFAYTSTGILLNDLYIRTPGSELQRSAIIRYASPSALSKNAGATEIDIDLDKSKLLVADLLAFAPAMKNTPAFASPNTTWFVDTRITGRLSDLQIDHLQLSGLQDTRIDIAGNVKGLPDINQLQADLAIHNISSSKRDIQLFIPRGSLPSNITLPQRFNTNGELKTTAKGVAANLRLNTDLGNARINGTFRQIADASHAAYDVTVNTDNMNVGTIIQNKEIAGPVSATFTASGIGYDPKTATARIDGVIHSANIHQYNYKNAEVHANVANQQATVRTAIQDPNADFNLSGAIDLSAKYPSLQVSGMIDSIKLQQLHITSQPMILRSKIDANIPVSDPDHLQGTIYLTQTLFVNDRQRLNLDTVQLVAGENANGNYLQLRSDVMNANIEGQYQLSQLPVILQNAIQPYFAVAPTRTFASVSPYDFTLTASIADNPALKTFVPGLERMDSVFLRSHFADSAWNATVNASAIDLNGNHLRNLSLQAGTGANAIALTASVGQLRSGSNIELNNTSLDATIANNQIDFNITSRDRTNTAKYHIEGLLNQPRLNNYELSLSPDSLLLNYQLWSVNAGNKIIISPDNIQASNFTLSKSGQQLTINSLAQGLRAPLQVDFTNFQLSTITGFIQADSNFVNGTMDGKLVITDISKTLFTSDLTISNFSLKKDTVGNVHALVSNRSAGVYNTDITLSGRGNDAKITGTYTPAGSNNFDMNLLLNRLPMTTVAALSDGKLRGATGDVNGRFAVSGNFQRPVIKGDLKFNQAGFNFSMLNSYFKIDNETLAVDEQGIRFSRFEIRDSANNPMIIDGLVGTRNFVNYNFDLDVRATNFRALNSTKKDNRLFYGQLYFNTNLKINGTESAPVVDGRLEINNKTRMTVVLPQREPGVVEREGIIEFIDQDAPLNDSLFLAAYDSMNMSGFRGMDIAVNIIVVPEAEFSLIIDEGNGDFLNVRGDAALTAGIDPSGKILLSGSYEIEQGAYELTFNLLRRRFDIQKGSRITWEGEPTDATLDIEAVYVANAAPLDLVKDQLGEASSFTRNTYLQKLPFDVHLSMEGKLLQPEIEFDIVLPDNKNYAVSGDIITDVRTRLDQLRIETGEMNKQVFSLLLLNRFITENPFAQSGGGPSASSLARQSVSRLLTEQLNNLAGDLIAGVDINFDVLSSEDYTTGERRDRTDLNVALSKRLLNDRLTVSIGSNFELEGPQNSGQQSNNIAGNVALDYRLSRDNRYVLRAYRKNEYQGIIEGYVIETGVAFIINVDYNRFKEIFISKKEREQKRQRRQEQRKINEEQLQKTAASDSTRVGG